MAEVEFGTWFAAVGATSAVSVASDSETMYSADVGALPLVTSNVTVPSALSVSDPLVTFIWYGKVDGEPSDSLNSDLPGLITPLEA